MRKAFILLAIVLVSFWARAANMEPDLSNLKPKNAEEARSYKIGEVPGASIEPSVDLTTAGSGECNSPFGDCYKNHTSGLLTDNREKDFRRVGRDLRTTETTAPGTTGTQETNK